MISRFKLTEFTSQRKGTNTKGNRLASKKKNKSIIKNGHATNISNKASPIRKERKPGSFD